ncbi:MAG: hypothetical protein ACI8UX_001161, partial [Psychromonas sp.]
GSLPFYQSFGKRVIGRIGKKWFLGKSLCKQNVRKNNQLVMLIVMDPLDLGGGVP